MRKIDELDNPQSTLNKADNNELLFILRAQDVSSPLVVIEWIKQNFLTSDKAKLMEAFMLALQMKEHRDTKIAD